MTGRDADETAHRAAQAVGCYYQGRSIPLSKEVVLIDVVTRSYGGGLWRTGLHGVRL